MINCSHLFIIITMYQDRPSIDVRQELMDEERLLKERQREIRLQKSIENTLNKIHGKVDTR